MFGVYVSDAINLGEESRLNINLGEELKSKGALVRKQKEEHSLNEKEVLRMGA